jgi:hypothetical protein
MKSFALETLEERSVYINQYAAAKNIPAYIVEKDFWVCWMLARIFSTPRLGPACVFKGGTSLSKVFGAIERFSEDIDLAISTQVFGLREEDLDNAASTTMRRKLVKKLDQSCAEAVEATFQIELETAVSAILGNPTPGTTWLTYQFNPKTKSPELFFPYPQSVPPGPYVPPVVKVEFGSLTDQRPTGAHQITAMVASIAPEDFDDFHAEVVALEIERTFWEKVTILHTEYHRPSDQPLRDRFSRHYADVAALWSHPCKEKSLARLDLLERVRLHKSRYYESSWSSYDTAILGSLKLLPSKNRIPELRRDYAAMQPMFLSEVTPTFEQILSTLSEAERELNEMR